uniref:Neuronal vesicle trafficking-associated protein 1 n=1 Tax=Monopterus albus TaxID=43700 RepID=A0A3Q3IB07_MONAL
RGAQTQLAILCTSSPQIGCVTPNTQTHTHTDVGTIKSPHQEKYIDSKRDSAELVVVKTKADYDGDSKKRKLQSPKIAEFSISVIEGVSERLKVTLLVICALAFLVCVVFLVVYKVYQYEQACPDSFVYMQGRCMPAGMYGNYPPQGPGGRGRLFTLINHYNIAKQTITRSVSPWMTIMSEEKVTQQETETAQKLA